MKSLKMAAAMDTCSDTDSEVIEVESIPDFIVSSPSNKYRFATLGECLLDTVGELMYDNKISLELCEKILCQYDRSMRHALSSRVKTVMSFKAEKLKSYKFVDGVWTFTFDKVEFREFNCVTHVDKLLVEAFDNHPKVSHSQKRKVDAMTKQ